MNYTLNDYQIEAQAVRLPSAGPMYALYGLSGEVGELHSLVAKAIRDGRKFTYDSDMRKELGDVLWFVSAIAADHGFTLEEVALTNIQKLTSRKERGTLHGSGDNR